MFDKFNGPSAGKPKEIPLNVDIKFGEAEAAIPCIACGHMDQAGFFVIVAGKVFLTCIKCIATGLNKWQKMRPLEKLVNVDVNADEAEYARAADAIHQRRPDLGESEALELAKAAIDAV